MKSSNNLLFAGMRGRLEQFVVYQMNGETVVRSRPYAHGRSTARQQESQQELKSAAQSWQLLTQMQRDSWNALHAKMPAWGGADWGATTSGYHLYVAVARSRGVLGLPPLADAPFAPTLPPFLGDMKAHLSFPGDAFLLTVTGPRFDAPVQVLATRWQSAGRDALATRDWKQIDVLEGIGEQGVDLTDAYRGVFFRAAPGSQVGVRLCPISEEGFRSPPLSIVAGPL